MKRSYILAMFAIFLCEIFLPVLLAQSSEVAQLKQEIHRLRQRIEELEKKQTESGNPAEVEKLTKRIEELEKKQTETEKKMVDTDKKVEKVEKKTSKDRIACSGEARFRIMSETDKVGDGFYGNGKPAKDSETKDEFSFPMRIRLNLQAEAIPDAVDFYARITINKRFGAYSTTPNDPFDHPNAFEASIGHDVNLRFEQCYATFKIPSIDATWYIGRLPGLDGPPSRASRSLFPRLFIDSEIDGTLFQWNAPSTALDEIELPWTKKMWTPAETPAPSLEAYERKSKEKSGLILGYLKYDERGASVIDDCDVALAQGELKIGKDTAIILSGIYMNDWHMPKTTFKGKNSYTDSAGNRITIPDLTTDYFLGGVYVDTQLFGLQIYGGYYYCAFEVPEHRWQFYHATTKLTTTTLYERHKFHGYIWYLGFNSGDLLGKDHQVCIEYAQGSDAWINPFNYRGYRRKGTVGSAANNYYYNPVDAEKIIVGFYPFNAQVWDIYYDYYFQQKIRFRAGIMAFIYEKHHSDIPNSTLSVFGSSSYETAWWPYAEVNISF